MPERDKYKMNTHPGIWLPFCDLIILIPIYYQISYRQSPLSAISSVKISQRLSVLLINSDNIQLEVRVKIIGNPLQ